MAQTIKDADGKDIQVFTADEVKAQSDAAIAEYTKAHPDQSAALTDATTKLADATKQLEAAKLAGGDDKDENIRNLRSALKIANDNIEKVKVDVMKEVESAKNAPTVEYKTDVLDQLSGKDATLKEKISIKYAALSGMPEGTKAEVKARMEEAYKLAADKPVPGILDGGTGMGNRGTGGMPSGNANDRVSDNSKMIGKELGITDEQAAKYAPKPGQPGYQA